MAKSFEREKKHIITGLSAHGWTGRVCWLFGLIFAMIGVIGEATSNTLGLQPMSWYLLSIAAFASSTGNIVAWVGGLYICAEEAKK